MRHYSDFWNVLSASLCACVSACPSHHLLIYLPDCPSIIHHKCLWLAPHFDSSLCSELITCISSTQLMRLWARHLSYSRLQLGLLYSALSVLCLSASSPLSITVILQFTILITVYLYCDTDTGLFSDIKGLTCDRSRLHLTCLQCCVSPAGGALITLHLGYKVVLKVLSKGYHLKAQ